MGLVLTFTVLFLMPTEPVAASRIAHCRDTEGTLIFTDPPCPPHAIPVEWRGGTMSIIEFETVPGTSSQRDRTRSQPTPRVVSDRRAQCAQTELELKSLRAERRRGYQLADEPELDAALARLKKAKRQLC